MDMGGHGMAGVGAMPAMQKHYTHMTFYSGWKSEILFTGWPGARRGMYALALAVVFVLALVLELLASRALESRLPSWRRRVAAGTTRTALYAVRIGVAYLLMLALMSFNVGVFVVAVAGHAAGFLAFRAAGKAQVEDGCKEEPPPAACC
jgi:solute carrier family 31 (copper transporter), member 1